MYFASCKVAYLGDYENGAITWYYIICNYYYISLSLFLCFNSIFWVGLV